MKNKLFGECVAEFIGTFIFMFVGIAIVAQLVVTGTSISLWELSFCWGIAITIAIYMVGAVSGAHMNPARDLGPRLWLMLSGWGTSVIGPNGYGLIVPVIATTLGGIIGGGIYEKLVVPFLPGVFNVASAKSKSV